MLGFIKKSHKKCRILHFKCVYISKTNRNDNRNTLWEVFTMRKELLKGLSEEQIKKVEVCKSPEEILSLAKAEGVELNEEQLAAVSGGACNKGNKKCPKCGSDNWNDEYKVINHIKCRIFKFNDCGHSWKLMPRIES